MIPKYSPELVRYNTALQYCLPLLAVLDGICTSIETSEYMSIEFQTLEGLHLQDEEKSDQMLKNIEQEMECPRCYNIMTLSFNFDRLGYSCQECDLLLVMK